MIVSPNSLPCLTPCVVDCAGGPAVCHTGQTGGKLQVNSPKNPKVTARKFRKTQLRARPYPFWKKKAIYLSIPSLKKNEQPANFRIWKLMQGRRRLPFWDSVKANAPWKDRKALFSPRICTWSPLMVRQNSSQSLFFSIILMGWWQSRPPKTRR